MVAQLVETSYRVQKTAHAVVAGVFMRIFHQLVSPGPLPSPAAREALQRRFKALIDQDLANVRAGLYPERLLWRTGLRDTLKVLPGGFLEVPRVILRARRQGYDDLPPESQDPHFPGYYRRTFHWQSDGWFSERSARMYDPGVELLFGGTADVMRRMILPDLATALRPLAAPRLLDVACGTGRFLDQLHTTLPHARLTGLDLSAPYLKFARDRLAHVPDLSLVAANAEAMPLADASFDAVTSVFLFHELPSDARRNVLAECLRVLRPGGLLAILDSTQLDDSPELAFFLGNFPRLYHEPYYKGYSQLPLPELVRDAGFELVSDRTHFLARAVIARRPSPAPTETSTP